ncbi:PTS system, beta-glucoside-specific IIABC component [Leclercia adecarboxylata]|uniref:PTS system, beta-glucoside-specific IIABC component n=1 Tax=Leclercia adecarboxylata TaxID=83655 RepID=A0A4V6JL88_9ENTR|nr:PTS system, beta-glucoside-specific IIABC component [Leclercia adecarboxylata]
MVIGPIGIWLGKGLAFFIEGLFSVSASFAGLIVGAIRPVAILTGDAPCDDADCSAKL